MDNTIKGQTPRLSDLKHIYFDGCLGECGVYISQAMLGDRRASRAELDHIEAHEMDAIREMAKRHWDAEIFGEEEENESVL